MRIVAIVPVLDEQHAIDACLLPLVGEAEQVIVVDGGSADDTRARARAAGATVLEAPRGRAAQMNAGAACAGECDALIFVHADTQLPTGWSALVARALDRGRHAWGRFDVHLDSDRPLLRVVANMMNLRSRVTGICTGDQAMFVTRAAWNRSGGFPRQLLMEDIDLSARMRRCCGAPASLRARVRVSARRWESHGAWRTIAMMTLLRTLHFLGVPPAFLHRLYYARKANAR